MTASLRIGTRGSRLALWQTGQVEARLRLAGHSLEHIEIRTTGDVVTETALSRIGDTALFTRQLDDAILEQRIDLAVHSLKDLPTVLPDGISIVAIGEREDPRDALVGRGPMQWRDLPQGATVATCSLRRRAQLLAARPDLSVTDIRGNVDTRVSRLDSNPNIDAILLACAGLDRLGLSARIGERLPLELMLPAPGQGAIAVTARSGDAASRVAAHSAWHHQSTALCVSAERALLRGLDGGCQVPVAAHATLHQAQLRLTARVISLQGDAQVSGDESGAVESIESAEAVGTRLAQRLMVEGADRILIVARAAASDL